MKDQRSKNILISCAVILVVACLCLSVLVIAGIGVSLAWPIRLGQGDQIQSPLPSAEDESFVGEVELPGDLAEQLSGIESQVIELRGINLQEAVTHTLISPDELQEIVVTDFFAEYTDQDAQRDVLVLSALGLLPENFDLKGLYQVLYSEQIAGFYDDEIKEIYVVSGSEFGGLEKMTYAHEFTHVLQDQAYRLSEGLGLNDEACEADSEKCAATQALIEGDATKTELLWFEAHASRQDYLDVVKSINLFETPIYDTAPPFLQADLYFPYEKGLAFVEHLFEQGGFGAVDEAYQNLPVSTEQILHPERYPADVPQSVSLPDLGNLLGEDWELFDQNVMGEWYSYLILAKAYQESHQIPERVAEEAAAGWGGDAYAFYLNEKDQSVTFVMESVWDTEKDADEFAEAFSDYADLRWQESDTRILGYPSWTAENVSVVFLQEGIRTLWLMAPTEQMVLTILSELQ